MIDRRRFLGVGLGALLLQRQTPSDADPLREPATAGKSRLPVTEFDNSDRVKGIERQLRCTCGCNLDVFTCRTTDFTCEYSPRMHLEVMDLVKQGKNPEEVVAAFVAKHGEQILMAPRPVGFNLAGYLVPGTLILLVGIILAVVLLRRHRLAQVAGGDPVSSQALADPASASEEDLERLKRALSEVAD
jgi:cytochrome c-type biogenesis protein CcmH/NrfF